MDRDESGPETSVSLGGEQEMTSSSTGELASAPPSTSTVRPGWTGDMPRVWLELADMYVVDQPVVEAALCLGFGEWAAVLTS